LGGARHCDADSQPDRKALSEAARGEICRRGALEERTNEMTAAAVARPVGMEVATARCSSGAEWRRQKDINRRAKEVIRARQKKADEDESSTYTEDVVRQSAGAAEKKRKRRAEKNKRHRKNKQVKRIHEEWKEELKEKAEEDWEAQSNAVVEEGAVLVAVQWRTRQAVRALRAARWQQQMQELSEWKAEQFGGARVQLGRGWHRWRQRCIAPDTSTFCTFSDFWYLVYFGKLTQLQRLVLLERLVQL